MKPLQWMCLALFIVLLYGIVRASMVENVLVGGRRMLADPWSLATLIDAYVGFCVASVWIFAVERKKTVAAGWIVALMLLGNLASLAWLFLRLRRTSSLAEAVGSVR